MDGCLPSVAELIAQKIIQFGDSVYLAYGFLETVIDPPEPDQSVFKDHVTRADRHRGAGQPSRR